MTKGFAMRRLVPVFVALACAACASTPSDVASRQPIDTFTTSKAPQAFVECATPMVLKDMPLSRVVPKQGGQQIIASGSAYGAVAALIDVDSSGTGSAISVRGGSTFQQVKTAIVKDARSCQ